MAGFRAGVIAMACANRRCGRDQLFRSKNDILENSQSLSQKVVAVAAHALKIRCSIVVSISACPAEDPGSIPGRGVFVCELLCSMSQISCHFACLRGKHSLGGVCGPDRTGPDRTEPDRTGLDWTELELTGRDRTEPDQTRRADSLVLQASGMCNWLLGLVA